MKLMNHRQLQLLQIGNIIAVIITIIINSLANVIPIGGNTTQKIADSIPNLFVPAGLTFAIWGVIYVLTILFAIYLARDLFKKDKITQPFLEKISYLFIIACAANIAWIFLWHYEQIILSILPMLVLFISLLVIYLRLNIGKDTVLIKDKLFIHLPISVYIGWITVATIANVTAVLVTIYDNIGIGEQQILTILILIIATILTILMLLKRKDYAYSAVIIWAFLGIYIKRITNDPVYGVQLEIAYTALVMIVLIAICALIIFFKSNHDKKHYTTSEESRKLLTNQ